MVYDKQPEEIKGLRKPEIIAILVSWIVAVTSLLSNSGNVPSWWFQFSLAFLIALLPIVFLFKPITSYLGRLRLELKQNAISRRYFPEFRDLVESSKRLNDPLRDLFSALTNNYQNHIQSSVVNYIMQRYQSTSIDNMFYYLNKEIDESKQTFRELVMIVKHFESVFNIYRDNLKIIEVFVHEIVNKTDKPIAKGIEDKFEAYREKFNLFLHEMTKFCHKINQETGVEELPEYAFREHLQKW